MEQEGVEEVVVALPPGASEMEISDLTLKVATLPEKKPEPAEGEEQQEEATPPEGDEEVEKPADEELDKALAALQFEAGRRSNGLLVDGCEESMRWLASLMTVFVANRGKVNEGTYLWENIYPKIDPEGKCCISKSGKYAVKLWIEAEWRTVWVDDTVPFDAEGKPMLPCSALKGSKVEIWPMLLAKAALKAHQGLSTGDAVKDAMAFATAITGWLCALRPRKEYTFDQWPTIKAAVQDPNLMASAFTLKEGGLQPEGLKSSHAHAVTTCVEVLGQTMIRLESNESACAPLLLKEKEKAANVPSSIESESLRAQLEGALEVYAARHTDTDHHQCSFWVSGSDFDACFDTVCMFYNTANHEHKHTEKYEWTLEMQAEFFKAPPCLLIQTDNETPQEVIVSLSSAATNWTTPEPAEPDEADGDAAKPELPIKPPPPLTSVTIEEWDWQAGPVKRVGQGSTSHNVSVAFKVPAGKRVYRLHLDSVVGYTVYASSTAAFSLGGYESVLKENAELPSVCCEEADTTAVKTGQTAVVFRANVMLTEDTTVAAYLQVTNPAMESSYRLRFIDNGASTSTPYMSLHMPGRKLAAAPRGYTLVLECTAPADKPAMATSVRLVVIGDKEGVSASMSSFEALREVTGEQELNLSKDTVLLKYLMEPSGENEVASFELTVGGSNRSITMEFLDKDQKVLQCHRAPKRTTMVYAPLPQTSDETYTLLCTVMAPDADLMAHEAEELKELKKKAKESAEEGQEINTSLGMKCDYNFTIHSLTPYSVSVDTRRQDFAAELKGQWESAEGGRAERAKGARDKFLSPPALEEGAEEVNLGAKDPAKAKRPVVKDAGFDQKTAKVMPAEDRATRIETCEKQLEDYNANHGTVKEARTKESDAWRANTEERTAGFEGTVEQRAEFWTGQEARVAQFKETLVPRDE